MLKKFISLCFLFILIGGGYILYKQSDVRDGIVAYIKSFPSVKGISVNRTEDVSSQLKSKVNKEISKAEKNITNTKISDIINIYNQTKKYAEDFRAFQEYVKKEAGNLIK